MNFYVVLISIELYVHTIIPMPSKIVLQINEFDIRNSEISYQ